MGWFFGFKLHLVFNNCHEIVALKLTPGNDTTPVPALTRELTGKLFGDKGYIGRKLAEDLLRRGLTLWADTVHPRPQEHEVAAHVFTR